MRWWGKLEKDADRAGAPYPERSLIRMGEDAKIEGEKPLP